MGRIAASYEIFISAPSHMCSSWVWLIFSVQLVKQWHLHIGFVMLCVLSYFKFPLNYFYFLILKMPLVSSLKCFWSLMCLSYIATRFCFGASQEYPSTVIYDFLHPSCVEQFLPQLAGALEAQLSGFRVNEERLDRQCHMNVAQC